MAAALAQAGVKRIYGVVGDSLNGFTDALRRLDAQLNRLLRDDKEMSR